MHFSRWGRPARIAMVNASAPGHIYTSLEVIRELAARGHRVTYAIPEKYADIASSVGAEPKPYHCTLGMDTGDWLKKGPIGCMEAGLTDSMQALPQLAAAYADDDPPDLVLYDWLTPYARILARRWGVPAVMLAQMSDWEPTEEQRAEAAQYSPDPRHEAHERRYRHWLDQQGFADMDVYTFANRPDRSLGLIPRFLQPYADRIDPAVHTFVGACLGDRSHQGGWQRPPATAPTDRLLLITLGTSYSDEPGFFDNCVEAFGNLPGWHVVLHVWRDSDRAALGPVPANIEVHGRIPQLAILRQADALISRGGMGAVLEALDCEVPMVTIPRGADQFLNSQTLRELGVAREIPAEEVTAKALRTAVTGLVDDPEVADRLSRLKERMVQEGGAGRAADLIEAELR
ncbi:glycosyltransferase [Streptomyces sp. ID05-39B]|uniref:macrolide family glycosyltransferase n=1 Tax=Streptomyces sp. ID05-39B TaxID=3028664 RepID=UPI0029A48CEB|nr:macrolide family glycosyltransferase [Streptomyces sp. ID05-39B]MDX3527246.1 glycosyltransferase [Streptomyces sp. ID05-39B]